MNNGTKRFYVPRGRSGPMRRPTVRYQWYLSQRPTRPERFSDACRPMRLYPGTVLGLVGQAAWIGAREGGTSFLRPVVCLHSGQAGGDQNNARFLLRAVKRPLF
jgi:hypothetical protein